MVFVAKTEADFMAVPFTFLYFSYFVRLNLCKCLLLPILLLPPLLHLLFLRDG